MIARNADVAQPMLDLRNPLNSASMKRRALSPLLTLGACFYSYISAAISRTGFLQVPDKDRPAPVQRCGAWPNSTGQPFGFPFCILDLLEKNSRSAYRALMIGKSKVLRASHSHKSPFHAHGIFNGAKKGHQLATHAGVDPGLRFRVTRSFIAKLYLF